jgi:hypothetical protein
LHELDLPSRLDFNRKRTERYHLLTTSQAQDSYLKSQLANSTGLILLVLGTAITLSRSDASLQIAAAVLTAVGTVLWTYIARTYLRIHEKALEQLNFYFEQPVLESRHLTAERLARELQEPSRSEAIALIIKDVLTKTQDDLEGPEWSENGEYLDEPPSS